MKSVAPPTLGWILYFFSQNNPCVSFTYCHVVHWELRSLHQFLTLRSASKKHSTFCMNNLYRLRDEYSLRFSKHLHCKHLTSRGSMFLQLCSFRVSRPLVQSVVGSYLKDNASEGAQESSESNAGKNSRDNYIWWMARASYMPGAVGYTEVRGNGTDGEQKWRRCRRKLKAAAPISSVPRNKWSRTALSNLRLFLRAAMTAHIYIALCHFNTLRNDELFISFT